MTSEQALHAACPFVRQLRLQRRPGDDVRAMDCNADFVGYVLFDIERGATWARCAEAITARLGLYVLDGRMSGPRSA